MGDKVDNVSKASNKLISLGEKLTNVSKMIPVKSIEDAVNTIADSTSRLQEAQRVVDNTFNSSSKSVEAWSETVKNSAGISKTVSTQWVASMGSMLMGTGVSETAAAKMSEKLVQLTGDMSSFHNISSSDMWEMISAGINGDTGALKKLNIDMSSAKLNAFALAEGMKKPYDQMSQSEQTMLRYNYILNETKNAQGDFAKSMGSSYEKQMLMAKLNVEELSTTLGKKFLPELTDSVKGINKFMEALNNALNGKNESSTLGKTISSIANAVGRITPENAKSILDIGVAITSLAPGIKIFGNLTTAIGKFQKSIKGGVDAVKGGFKKDEKVSTKKAPVNNMLVKSGDLKKTGKDISSLSSKLDALKKSIGIFRLAAYMNFKLFASDVNKIFNGVGKNYISLLSGSIGKITSLLGKLGNKSLSGLKSMVGLSLKMIAPAALIGVLLLGLGVAQKQMGGQLDKVILDITKKGPQFVQSFTKGLLDKIPDVVKSGTTLLIYLVNALISNAPSLIKSAAAIIASLVNGVASNTPRLIPVIVNLIQTILISIVNNLPLIVKSGLNLLLSLAQGISNNIDKIVNTIVNIITQIIKVISKNLPLIIQIGIKILATLIEGIVKAIPSLIAAIPQIVNALWNGITSINWAELGMNIIRGIGEGIVNSAKYLYDKLASVAKAAKDGVKDFLGIHSPSTVFRDEVGQFIPAGIAEGISYGSDVVNARLKDLSNKMVSSSKFNLIDNISKLTQDEIGINNSINIKGRNAFGINDNKLGTTINQYNTINSPKALNPSETARQSKKLLQEIALKLS